MFPKIESILTFHHILSIMNDLLHCCSINLKISTSQEKKEIKIKVNYFLLLFSQHMPSSSLFAIKLTII